MTEAWIIDACRTPRAIGKAGKGALCDIHPQQLGGAVLAALAARTGIDTADLDDVIWGTSAQVGRQRADLGRMSALDAGYDIRASGVTLDRFCGSGITAVSFAAATVMSGMQDLVIGGGTEMMSGFGRTRSEGPSVFDLGNLHLRALHPQTHQGICADGIASYEGISREDLDRHALVSHQRAAAAVAEGRFDRSLVTVRRPDGSVALDREEFVRPHTSLEALSALKPSFEALADHPVDETGVTYRELFLQKYPGLDIRFVHHAGNSSGVVDGSGAVLVASPEYAQAHGLKPRARVRAIANMGACPTMMVGALGPSVRKVLAKAGMEVGDVDLFEINEAFAVVTEKFARDFDVDRDKLNVNGGAIGLGHPIGATGAILIGTVIDELERRDRSVGLVAMCAGGGMAPAIVVERMN